MFNVANMAEILDETDLQILKTLQKNAKLTTKELADAVHLTPTPVFERQKRLEKKGYIKKYVAILDPEKLNQGLLVFCKVKLTQINHEIADAFVRRIQRIPEVTECYNTSGAYDYLLKVRARDMKQYQEFVLTKLGDIDHVGAIESTFVMSEVKQNYGINIWFLLSLNTGTTLDVVADLRAVVLPDVARTIGVLQELVGGGPVVA